ncbi:hypothetical protein VaNZ11_006217, partial [Volvox africanus]
ARVGSVAGGSAAIAAAAAAAVASIAHGASRGNLLSEVPTGSVGDDDGVSTPHTGGGSPHTRGYSRSHSQFQTNLRAVSGDLSIGSGGGGAAAATTATAPPPSRSISNGFTGLLHKLLHNRSTKGQSPASSDVSMAYEDGSTSMRSGGGRLDQQLLMQQLSGGPQSLRRKSVTVGAARSNVALMVPGSTSLRLSHPSNALIPDMETAAAGPPFGGGGGGGGTTGQVTVAAMRLASISAGASLAAAARLASVSAGALTSTGAPGAGGGAAAIAAATAPGGGNGGLPGHLHHHHHHLHSHHGVPRGGGAAGGGAGAGGGGGVNNTRDLLANGTVYHGQHPLGPGVVNLGFG